MEHAWKVCVRLSVPRVRIPPFPPDTKLAHFTWAFLCLAEEEGLVHSFLQPQFEPSDSETSDR